MENISIEQALPFLEKYGLPLVWAVIILILGLIAAKIITKIVKKALKKSKVDEIIVKFIGNLLNVALIVFVVLAALERIGVETTSFAAVIAAAGLAIGLALQGSLSNFASGVLLIIFRPFKAGDFIDAGGAMGVVEEIQIFTTKLRSPDNKEIIIPNGQITGSKITNFSTKDTRRVDLVIGVSYDDDLKKVKETLHRIIGEDERILKDPKVTIGLLEMADSSINFAVRPWVKTADYWNVYFDLMEKIKLTFDEENITIPYPQQDVHFFNETKEK